MTLTSTCSCCLVHGRVTAPIATWKGTPVCSWHLALSSGPRSASGAVAADDARQTADDMLRRLTQQRDQGSQQDRPRVQALVDAAMAGLTAAQDDEHHRVGGRLIYVE